MGGGTVTDKEFDRLIGALEPEEDDDDPMQEYWDKYDADEERGKEIRKYGRIE